MGNLSPKKKESSPAEEVTQEKHTVEESTSQYLDDWEITDQWEEETGDVLNLTQKELDDLSQLITQGDDQEILADHHLHVKRSDLNSLYRTNYLNDTVIDEYLLMLKARDPERVAVMNTYFFQKFDSLSFDEAYEDTRP